MAQRQCSADSNESMSKIPRGKILSLPFPARISRRPLPHARRSRGRFCAPPFASHRWQLPSPLLGAPPSCVKRGGGSRGSGTSFSVGQRLGADRDTAAMTILPSRSVSRPASRRLLPRSTNNPVFSLLFFRHYTTNIAKFPTSLIPRVPLPLKFASFVVVAFCPVSFRQRTGSVPVRAPRSVVTFVIGPRGVPAIAKRQGLLTLLAAALGDAVADVLEAAPGGLDRAEDVGSLEVDFDRVGLEESPEAVEYQGVDVGRLD